MLVVWDEPMLGVGRPWFECPLCKRRSRHLYLRDPIACRRCHGLRYLAENRQQTPGVGRVERLRRKLGDCDTRPFAPLPARRPGRSKACHEQLVAMIHAEESRLVEHLRTMTHDLERRIAVRTRHFPDAETFLMVLLNTPDVAVELKVRCAIALLPFQLAPVAERGVKAERQERAEAIKDRPFATPPAPKRPN